MLQRDISPIESVGAYLLAGLAAGFLGCLSAAPASAGSGKVDTLTGVVVEALRTNPELGAIRHNRRAIDHELRAARGLGLPTIDFKGDFGRHRDSLKTQAGIEDTDDWHSHRQSSLVLSQRIFDGFERTHEVARQKNRVESARWRVADTANSIALKAIQAYYELRRASSVLAAARSNLSSLQRLASRVRARVRAGHGGVAEGSEAGSRVANAKALVVEAEARLEDAKALFRSVVGRAPRRPAHTKLPLNALPRTLIDAVREARRASPSVIATQHDYTAARATIATAYSRYYPKVNFELSARHGKGVYEKDDREVDARALFVVRWNLLNGGIDRARVLEATERASEAGQIAENTRRIVERETRVSWTAMIAARRRVPALRRQLALSRATRATYSKQFDTGSRRLLDLLDAQSEVFVAEASLRTEIFVGQFNTYRILAAVGRLVHSMGLELPDEAVRGHSRSILDSWKTRLIKSRGGHGKN